MKQKQTIIEWLNDWIESLRTSIKESTEKTDLRLKREGALAMAEQTLEFIQNEKWVTK